MPDQIPPSPVLRDEFDTYCMKKSPEGHSCGLPKDHPEPRHFGGSPMLPEIEWVWWDDPYITSSKPNES